ncbi:hypothetical protein AAE478_002300 [Parahypoxylon ruwenzoriense]
MVSTKTYLDLIKACDNFPYIDISQTPYTPPSSPHHFYQLLLPGDPRPHGYLHPSVVAALPWSAEFSVTPPSSQPSTVQILSVSGAIDSDGDNDTVGAINRALLRVVQRASEAQLFPSLTRRRPDEDFRIPGARHPDRREPVRLRRAAAGLFGIACLGAHMTMYVRDAETGEPRIWVPRRSARMRTYPGKLDSSVAGGVRADESPLECLAHEADEEASLPPSLIRERAQACGAVTYVSLTEAGSGSGSGQEPGLMASGVLYVYDLEVGPEIVPKPQDDEVEAFYLWDVPTVKEALLRGEFKTNSASVMIDFFVRHGIITDANEPDYLEIVTRLHRTLPVPTSAS